MKLSLATRYALVILILNLVAGCASYKQGAFPNADPMSETRDEQVEIRVGYQVRLETINGKEVSGEVIRVSENELVLGKPSNYGYEERAFDREEIASVRVRNDKKAPSLAVNTLGVVLIAFIGLAVLAGLTGGITFGSS